MARQFGLSQLLPKCFIPKGEAFFCSTDNGTEKWLKGSHEYYKKKEVFLHASEYKLSYHYTQEFEEFLTIHWQTFPDHTLIVQRLVDIFSFLRERVNFCLLDLK